MTKFRLGASDDKKMETSIKYYKQTVNTDDVKSFASASDKLIRELDDNSILLGESSNQNLLGIFTQNKTADYKK